MSGRNAAPLVLAIAVVLALAACASQPSSSALTLADSKSPVQLLRNEVASRIPEELVQQVVNEDYSEACGADESIRAWHSAIRLELGTDAAAVEQLIDELSASFEADGWIATPGNERLEQKQAVYTRGGTAAEIHLAAEDRAGVGHAVVVSVFGPCVQTDGPDSDEVTSLEGTN